MESDLKQNLPKLQIVIEKYFQKYVLPKFKTDINYDACANGQTYAEKRLELYQEFVGQYLNSNTGIRDILLYHGLGSGKTITAINVFNVLYNSTPRWNLFLLIPSALRPKPWEEQLKIWLKDYEKQYKLIHFIHFNAPNAGHQLLEAIKQAPTNNTNIFMIDEAHKFISNVYNNLITRKGERAIAMYNTIQKMKIANDNTRIILMSATPVVNNAFEFALIFNLMSPNAFPNNKTEFEDMYVKNDKLNPEMKYVFQKNIISYCSYFVGASADKFARKFVHNKKVYLDRYHEEIYTFVEHAENENEIASAKLASKTKRKFVSENTTFNIYTRHASNFVFPVIGANINGYNRPNPANFKISNLDINILENNIDIDNKIDEFDESYDISAAIIEDIKKRKEQLRLKNSNVRQYLDKCAYFVTEFKQYIRKLHEQDISHGRTVQDDLIIYEKKYNLTISDFIENELAKSEVFQLLYKCSKKFMMIILNIFKSPGSVLVFSNYIRMEGLEIFKVYLDTIGFEKYNSVQNSDKNFRRYVEYSGGVEIEKRNIIINNFNKVENKDGSVIKIILLSPTGVEGISLMNVRQVHIMEPYWNNVRVNQVIGRAIRLCSHRNLPMKDRVVDIYKYETVLKTNLSNGVHLTIEQKINNIARKKQDLLDSFELAVKETAIDCTLFKNVNMSGTSFYNCFKFVNSSIFNDSGPLLQKQKYENIVKHNYKTREVELVKIKAGQLIDNELTLISPYYMNKNDGTIYNINPIYLCGKLAVLDLKKGMFVKRNEVYVVKSMIDIPTIQLD